MGSKKKKKKKPQIEPKSAAEILHPAEDAVVEVGIAAQCVIDACAPFHQARQDVVQIAARKSVVRTIARDGQIDPGAGPM